MSLEKVWNPTSVLCDVLKDINIMQPSSGPACDFLRVFVLGHNYEELTPITACVCSQNWTPDSSIDRLFTVTLAGLSGLTSPSAVEQVAYLIANMEWSVETSTGQSYIDQFVEENVYKRHATENGGTGDSCQVLQLGVMGLGCFFFLRLNMTIILSLETWRYWNALATNGSSYTNSVA